ADLVSRANVAKRNETRTQHHKRAAQYGLLAAIRRVAPGSRVSLRSPETRERGVRIRGARSETLPVAAFTMSNSAVLFVPAARCCARVLAFPFASTRTRGGAERRQAHHFVCRACE